MKTKGLKPNELTRLRDVIFEKSGYWLKKTYLEQAFTRKSYSVQSGEENNEKFELIGDRVLSYYVIKAIVEKFGAQNFDHKFNLRIPERVLSNLESQIVNNETLANIIDEWGIAEFLMVGKCDEDNRIDQQIKPKADLFEAILGAIAIDSKWDSTVLELAVKKMISLENRLEEFAEKQYRPTNCSIENAVTTLKEIAEKGFCSVPKYEYGSPNEFGYDKNGNPIWCCTCSIMNDKTGIIRQVWCSSKKDAKKAAAYLVLCEQFELQNEYGINSKSIAWEFYNGKLLLACVNK